MNPSRAQEIIQSKAQIQVTYQGQPVWIEEVDTAAQTARVYPQGNPAGSMTVAVDKLVEQR